MCLIDRGHLPPIHSNLLGSTDRTISIHVRIKMPRIRNNNRREGGRELLLEKKETRRFARVRIISINPCLRIPRIPFSGRKEGREYGFGYRSIRSIHARTHTHMHTHVYICDRLTKESCRQVPRTGTVPCSTCPRRREAEAWASTPEARQRRRTVPKTTRRRTTICPRTWTTTTRRTKVR